MTHSYAPNVLEKLEKVLKIVEPKAIWSIKIVNLGKWIFRQICETRLFVKINLGMIHIWRPWILSNFQEPEPPCPSTHQPPPPPPSNDNQSVKRKHGPRITIICFQQSSLSLKDSFTVWRQSQKEDFLSIIYQCLALHGVWSWRKSNFL